MYLVKTAQKKVLIALLRKAGLEALPTRFSDMIICPEKPPAMFMNNGYIIRITSITEELAIFFIEPPESRPKEKDLVCVKRNEQEFIGTVHEVKNDRMLIMTKVLSHPRLIEVSLDEVANKKRKDLS
ncbi:MAG: hypothetical protein ABFD82_04165 [Syntrophaceae bacterium]